MAKDTFGATPPFNVKQAPFTSTFHINILITKRYLFLFNLAEEAYLQDKAFSLMAGEKINLSENKAALHNGTSQ